MLESPEAATEEEQGPALVLEREVEDAGDGDDVVAPVDLLFDASLDPTEGAVEDGGSGGRAGRPAHAAVLVGAAGGEAAAHRLLVLGEDVHAELLGRLDAGPRRRRLLGRE